MADDVLGIETSYQRWTNFKWADVLRLTALTRVFKQHFLPNSNGDASTILGITDPETWTREQDPIPVPARKAVKREIIPQKIPTASGSSNFIISLVSDSDEEETPAVSEAPAAAATSALDNATSPVAKPKKRGAFVC